MAEALNKARIFGLDTETTGLYWWRDKLVSVSLALESGQAWIVEGFWLSELRPWLQGVLMNPSFTIIGHNLKFDLHFIVEGLLNAGVPDIAWKPACQFIDTSIALFLLDENADNDLKSAVWRLFHYKMQTFKEMVGTVREPTGETRTRKCQDCRCTKAKLVACDTCKGTGVESVAKMRTRQRTIDEVPIEERTQYGADDAYYPIFIWKWAEARLEANVALKRNFYEVQMPLMFTLTRMEHAGIRIDMEKVRELKRELDLEAYHVDLKLGVIATKHLGHGLNCNSPTQLDEFLYRTLKLPKPPFKPVRKDASGARVVSKFRTDEACLIWLAQEQGCEFASLMLEHRRVTKLLTVYIHGLEENTVDGVLYPNFNQTIARSGRLSSSDPLNLQNIPIGPLIHQVFIAREGYVFVVADLGQAELRVLGHYSQDPSLMRVFLEEGRDLHQETADELGLSKYVPKTEARVAAKRGNFGVAYGIWGNTFRRILFVDSKGKINLSLEDANAVVTAINARYPGVTRWKVRAINSIKATGYAETLDGRRRRLPGISSTNWGLKGYSERQGVNVFVQGGVADIINRVMNEVDGYRKGMEAIEDAWPGALRLQVHDELVLEVKEEDGERCAADVKRIAESMTERFGLTVPVVCEPKVGKSWAVK
jgi:DNA polymerase-1